MMTSSPWTQKVAVLTDMIALFIFGRLSAGITKRRQTIKMGPRMHGALAIAVLTVFMCSAVDCDSSHLQSRAVDKDMGLHGGNNRIPPHKQDNLRVCVRPKKERGCHTPPQQIVIGCVLGSLEEASSISECGSQQCPCQPGWSALSHWLPALALPCSHCWQHLRQSIHLQHVDDCNRETGGENVQGQRFSWMETESWYISFCCCFVFLVKLSIVLTRSLFRKGPLFVPFSWWGSVH